MNNSGRSQNARFIARKYGDLVGTLKPRAGNQLDDIIDALGLRDRLGAALAVSAAEHEVALAIARADDQLRVVLGKLTRSERQTLRKIAEPLQADEGRWWWRTAVGRDLNPVTAIAIGAMWLMGAISIVYDVHVITMFWGNAPDFRTVAVQAVISLAATGTIGGFVRSLLLDSNGKMQVAAGAVPILAACVIVAITWLIAIPRISRYYSNAGQLALNQQRYTDAEAYLGRAARLSPTDIAPIYNLASLYEKTHRIAQANEAFLTCIALGNGKSVTGQRQLFLSYSKLAYLALSSSDVKDGSEFARAALAFRTAFDHTPSEKLIEHIAWRNYGWAQLLDQSPRDAKLSLDNAMSYGETPEARYIAGLTELKLRNLSNSRIDFTIFLAETTNRYDIPMSWIEEAKAND